MTFELVIGLLALAIAIGQILVDKPNARARTIAIATAAFAIGLFCWFGGNYVVAEERLHNNAKTVLDLLKDGPATYDDILKKDLGFAATDQVITYLAENKQIIPKTEDNVELHGKEHRVRFFMLPDKSR